MKLKGTVCGYKEKGESGGPEITIAISDHKDMIIPMPKKVIITEE